MAHNLHSLSLNDLGDHLDKVHYMYFLFTRSATLSIKIYIFYFFQILFHVTSTKRSSLIHLVLLKFIWCLDQTAWYLWNQCCVCVCCIMLKDFWNSFIMSFFLCAVVHEIWILQLFCWNGVASSVMIELGWTVSDYSLPTHWSTSYWMDNLYACTNWRKKLFVPYVSADSWKNTPLLAWRRLELLLRVI